MVWFSHFRKLLDLTIKENSFDDFNKNMHSYSNDCAYYLKYLRTTNLNISKPDLQWAKSIYEIILRSINTNKLP